MEPWQAILISAAVSAAAVFTTYCLGRRERKTERDAEHAEWVGEVNADRAWLKRAVASIQETVSDIFFFLSGGAISRNSPLQLTDFGRKISSDLGAKEWSERIFRSSQLKSEIQGMSFEEIEEFCLNFVLVRLDPTKQERRNLEKCARDNGVSGLVVRRVLAIEMRDELTQTSPIS